jgi:hypothetical protein
MATPSLKPPTKTTTTERTVAVLRLVAFEDYTAGATERLPETKLRMHFFLSAHFSAGGVPLVGKGARWDGHRRVVVRHLPTDGGVDSLRDVTLTATTVSVGGRGGAAAIPASAGFGACMFALSHADTDGVRRHFLVPVGAAFVELNSIVADGDVVHTLELYDYCDRGNAAAAPQGPGTLKGRLHYRCVHVDADVRRRLRRDAQWWEAVRANDVRLRAYTEQRMQAQLRAYSEQSLRPANHSVQRTHVIRVVLETTGRHVPAMYWLARAFRCSVAAQCRYWEGALRCALQLFDVTEREFLAWPADRPQKAAMLCSAAALFTNAGVTYVNDHVNRARRTRPLFSAAPEGGGSGDNIVDIERFMDPSVVRAADCEDSSSFAYWLLKYLHQADADDAARNGGATPLLRDAIRCVSTLYVPVVVIGEAVRPDAPERQRIEDYGDDELLGHFYCALVPAATIAAAMRRGGHGNVQTAQHVVVASPAASSAEPTICEGTVFQLGLVRPYADYAVRQQQQQQPPRFAARAAAAMASAAVHAAQEQTMRCMRRAAAQSRCVNGWTTLIDIDSNVPFYGRIVKLMSDVMHPVVWSLAVTYDDGVYGVTMQDFVAQSHRVVLRELTLQDDDIGRVATDAQAQCHPVAVPLPGDWSTFAVTAPRLRRLMPTAAPDVVDALVALAARQEAAAASAAAAAAAGDDACDDEDGDDFFQRQCRWIRTLWPLDAPPTAADVAAMRAMLANGTYRGVRTKLLHVSDGLRFSDAPDDGDDDVDEISARPVGLLVVELQTL